MSYTDRDTLAGRAYADGTKLDVRIELHRRHTRPRIDFQRWVLDRIAWSGEERVLDVGCGSGAYAQPVEERAGCYVAADMSSGMVADVDTPRRVVLLAESLPFADDSFDVVLANHMLYHVADRDRALAEFVRVLRSGGALLAATNDSAAPTPAEQIFSLATTALGHGPLRFGSDAHGFSLSSGAPLLERFFGDVRVERVESAIVLDTPEPAVAYAQSSRDICADQLPDGVSWDDAMTALERALRASIEQHGTHRFPKVAGAFVCRRAAR